MQEGAQQIENQVARHIGDARRQLAEQTLELRGLRGKNSAKVRLMLKRVDAETAEFEQCTTLLQAMRAVHGRMLKDMLVDLSSRPPARRGRRDAGVDGRVAPQPRREEGLRRAVRAAARRCSPPAQRSNGEIREMLGGVVRAASTPSSASA